MSQAVADLVRLERPIRTCWDTARVNNGHAAVGDKEACRLFDTTASAVTSELFWSQVKMLHRLCSLHEHMSSWVESCSCHAAMFKQHAQELSLIHI
eukprot:5613114-Alexandrium_andersonii.AAC.1